MAGAARTGGRGREAAGKAAPEAAAAAQEPPERQETPPASEAPPAVEPTADATPAEPAEALAEIFDRAAAREIQPTPEEAAALAAMLLPGFGVVPEEPSAPVPASVPVEMVITAVAQAPLLARLARAVEAATREGRTADAHALHAAEVKLTAVLLVIADARDAAGPTLGADLARIRALLT